MQYIAFILMFCAMFIVGSVQDLFAAKDVLRVTGGAVIEPLQIAIDAGYDHRLDNLVPGYRVINVVLINQSLNLIPLNPDKDRWQIKLDSGSRTYDAIHDLRSKDAQAWAAIPEKAKPLVAYPLVLPIGAREVIDLFVPTSIDVTKFNELDVKLQSLKIEIQVLVRQ